ncbi:gliding motility-associated C-terminal domain-containing protein [Mucilaginibacter gotjawali]|uniref:Gliding motility-associated-like protein n=1 Tax=Mucilaginibacter gotjawali TaxID=1550579 RepID=A0A839SKU9_9SPHI|nr:gliding motility-associated C-terminal domain-containing protein [Mucilaginibacter gotjawali]MBB3058905.1 gliding motility-associated-like protein [Mucilaginibacter gotjawali]
MKPLLLFIFLAFTLQVNAQSETCTGSLGDPVINQDFGSGTNPGARLPFGVTDMTYTANNCPTDGSYTIASSLTAANNTHPYTWYNVPHDHTWYTNGNKPDGYMMIVNASYAPSIFFTQTANGLCPNTKYFFSAYILNLMIPGPITASYNHPDITFSIETTDGVVQKTINTGPIPASGQNVGSTNWVQYGAFVTTPANATSLVVKMVNNAPGGNGNDFVLDDITFRACGPIILSGIGSITGGSNTAICQGTQTKYNLQASVIGDNSPVYQWQTSYNNGTWSDVTGSNSDALTVNFTGAEPPGIYQYRMGVANGSLITDAGCRVYSTPVTVTINPMPVVPPIPDQTVCETYPLTLTASGGASYTWTGPNMQPTSQNPLVIDNITPANAGTYTVVAVSDKGCPAPPVHTVVTVTPKIVPSISPDESICAGETTQLSSSGGKYYKWKPSTGLDHDDTPNPVASPLQTTTYTVHISNDGCADSTKTVTVTVNQNPVANAGNDIVLFEGQSAKLNGTIKGDNITGFSWSPATFLSDPNSLNPVASPTDNITYTLTAVSLTCGSSSSKVFVRVYKKIVIPNTFSPNNDGINDYWNIGGLVTYPQSALLVYNRYGQLVYQSTGYAKPWDGSVDGSPLPAGTYYYIIDLKNNTPKLSGWVLIVR